MLIESRKRNAKIMLVLWMIIPAILLIYSFEYPLNAFLINLAFISGLTMILGIPIYLGYNILAGFNTMNEKELKEYDMEKVSRFMGLTCILTAFSFFFVTFIIFLLTGDGPDALGIGFILLLLMILIPSFYVSNKRFKAKPVRCYYS